MQTNPVRCSRCGSLEFGLAAEKLADSTELHIICRQCLARSSVKGYFVSVDLLEFTNIPGDRSQK